MKISENAKGGVYTSREPVMLVHELIEVLERMPFDAIVNLRIKDDMPKEHWSKDADHKRVLTGRSNVCVFQSKADANVVIESWKPGCLCRASADFDLPRTAFVCPVHDRSTP